MSCNSDSSDRRPHQYSWGVNAMKPQPAPTAPPPKECPYCVSGGIALKATRCPYCTAELQAPKDTSEPAYVVNPDYDVTPAEADPTDAQRRRIHFMLGGAAQARGHCLRGPICSIGMRLKPSLYAGESSRSWKFPCAASTNPGSPSVRLSWTRTVLSVSLFR